MPEATTHTWQQSIRRRATIGDVCSAGSPQAAPKGLSEQLVPLEGVLHKQHRASKVLAWGKRYFRVDDLREALCYYRTEAQFERQDPVLRLPLRNLAAVRRLQQPPLEFLFELRLFSPVAVAGWAGRSCGNTGQQRPAIAADDDDNEYAYEVSDKLAPRSFIVRADTEAEAEAWVGGLQARIARRWHRPASARVPTPPLDPNIEEVCRALGAALSLDDHRCGGGTRPLTPPAAPPPAAPPPVPPATPRDSARQRDLGQDRVLGQDRDADVVPALDLQRRSWRRTSAEARRAPPGPSHPYALTPIRPHTHEPSLPGATHDRRVPDADGRHPAPSRGRRGGGVRGGHAGGQASRRRRRRKRSRAADGLEHRGGRGGGDRVGAPRGAPGGPRGGARVPARGTGGAGHQGRDGAGRGARGAGRPRHQRREQRRRPESLATTEAVAAGGTPNATVR